MRTKRTALLFGSGAVQNSWWPILESLVLDKGDQFSSDIANMQLALLVYNVRLWYADKNDPNKKFIYEEAFRILKQTRKSFCEFIEHHQKINTLKVHPEFENILRKIVLPDIKQLLLITTNWDTVVDDFLFNHRYFNKFLPEDREKFCTHLHGIYNNPNYLYLPTEVVDEPYRTIEQRHDMNGINASMMKNLIEADVCVIYGLSLSPLDAELIQILSAALNESEKIKSIKILDKKHCIVSARIKSILKKKRSLIIEEYNPEDLDNPITCSIY